MENDNLRVGAGAKRNALLSLGSRLRRARVRARLTQDVAARAVGTSAQTVRNWERGRHEPPTWAVKVLADCYKVSEEGLLKDLDAAILPVRPTPGFRYDRVVVDPEKLYEARLEARLSLTTVAELTGLSRSAIRRYETATANPATKTLETLASIYGRPAGWFTARGFFTDDEQSRFDQSVTPGSGKAPHDSIVIETYYKAKPDLSDEAELRIAKFILFTHEMELSGHNVNLFRYQRPGH